MHRVTYYNDVTIEDIPDGQTLLDASIRNRIPHLHQCGGRGRCTTCRVQILDGISHVSPRNPIEQKVVNQRGWDEFTRLACQTKVHGAVVIRRLLDNPQDIIVLDLDELHGVAAGEGKELELAILFSDIRNFTTHSEKNLPYDVLHMLNRHFVAAAEPVLNNNGFIDKYIGDGILAVFGTRDESPANTCRNAVRAALGMQDAAQRLSPVFEREFNMSLRIGIGIHFGTAILGRTGHPGKRQTTVIGDTVNTASRMESHGVAAAVQPKAIILLFRPVTPRAVRLEQRLDVAGEVDLCRLLGRCPAARACPHEDGKDNEEEQQRTAHDGLQYT